MLAPRYFPQTADPHAFDPDPPARQPGPLGVLMINLGTPDEPTAPSIRRYLLQFLSDPRVIEIPPWVWQVVLRAFILTRRPQALAPRYKEIWLDEGSPLLVYSQGLAQRVQAMLDNQGVQIHVELAMRYGNPSIADAMMRLRDAGCSRILTVPMYPQYAASTTATAVDAVAAVAARMRDQPELRFIKRYHDHPAYIGTLAQQIKQYWAEHGTPQRLLLSFHGLPRSVVEQGDPYYRDCMETAALLRSHLGEDGHRVHVGFQSRFGAQKWLEPYTEPTLKAWAKEGVVDVDVMCPGFLADCLETLEEIQMQCRDVFMAAGGRRFRYLPCLNDDARWAEGLSGLIRRHLSGWDDTPVIGIN